ncbi:MAG: SLBB domain-containing protein [Candidatus Cloacimonetes bacterium]|nr:SLBB domain-containing protein [Candidatus Cloacimonadota bacterium]
MSKLKKKYFVLIIIGFLVVNLPAQFSKYNVEETFYSISVVGAVDNPGVFLVPSSSRVSDVIKFSKTEFFEKQIEIKKAEKKEEIEIILPEEKYKGYIVDPEFEEKIFASKNESLRNVILRRGNEKIKVDLQRFFILGDESNNPYVLDGDIIIIPSKVSEVSIYGAVNNIGNYELTDNDRISDIIELALGLKPEAYLNEGEIVRFKDNYETEKLKFNLRKIVEDPEGYENLLLKNDDRIYIRSIPNFHIKEYANIAGEVKLPGIYAIEENKTTLLKILEESGGPTEKAELEYAFLQRKSEKDEIDPEFLRLKEMSRNEMTNLEYAYFKNVLREIKGKFSVDIENLWKTKDSKYDIILRSGDFVYIPENISTVSVSGQVKNPGLISFVPGENYEYYLEQAGGLVWNAQKSKIRLIRASSGKWIKPKKSTIIEEGDIIFIAEKPEIDYWKIIKDLFYTVTQVTALYIFIDSIITR